MLAEVAKARLIEGVPQYRGLPAGSHTHIRRSFSIVLDLIANQRLTSQDELSEIAAPIRERARHGVPLAAVFHGFTVCDDVLWEALSEHLAPTLQPVELVLELLQLRLTWRSQLFERVASVHREAELEVARDLQEQLAVSLLALLQGELPEQEMHQLARRLGLELDAPYFVWCVSITSDRDATLRRALGVDPLPPAATFASWQGKLVGLTSIPLAGQVPGLDGGLSGPVPLSAAHAAFTEAQRAQQAMTALDRSGVYSIPDLGLHAAVFLLPHVGAALEKRYVDALRHGALAPEELLETVKAHLRHQGRPDEAAQALHLHPNTVRYRLRRFTELTGVELTDHDVSTELWWLFAHLELADRSLAPEGPPG